jgi:hypothetical protein
MFEDTNLLCERLLNKIIKAFERCKRKPIHLPLRIKRFAEPFQVAFDHMPDNQPSWRGTNPKGTQQKP